MTGAQGGGIIEEVVMVFFVAVMFTVGLRSMHAVSMVGKQMAGEKHRREYEKIAERRNELSNKLAEEKARSRRRLANQPMKVQATNSFGRILKQKAENKKKREAQAAARPREAWLGKNKFICSESKEALQLQPRVRCWFGSCCTRSGQDHMARYTHPGQTDWTDKPVTLQLTVIGKEANENSARAFTQAGGRGDFIEMGNAAKFLREYSGLPVAYLRKIADVVGGFTMTARLRREQFALALQAVDAVQEASKGGALTVDDIVFDCTGQPAVKKQKPRNSWVESCSVSDNSPVDGKAKAL